MFNDENLILDIRLNVLNEYVDYFVIVESKYTHAGKQKKLNFDAENFKKFKDKIIYIITDQHLKDNVDSSLEEKVNYAWQLENFQRNEISLGLKDAQDADIIMISDVDEIPNLQKIDFKNFNKKVVCFNLKLFYYKLNLFVQDNWPGTKVCRMKDLKSQQWLRELKTHKKYSLLRIDKLFSKNYEKNFSGIKNGGWHVALIKKPNEILCKLESYAHLEHNIPSIKNLKHIENSIRQKKSFLNNEVNLKIVDIEKNLQNYIKENKSKFKDWLIE